MSAEPHGRIYATSRDITLVETTDSPREDGSAVSKEGRPTRRPTVAASRRVFALGQCLTEAQALGSTAEPGQRTSAGGRTVALG